MWEPEIIQREEDRSLIWIVAPFEMPRATYPLVGRTLLVDGVPHRIKAMMVNVEPRGEPIAPGEKMSLRVLPLDRST